MKNSDQSLAYEETKNLAHTVICEEFNAANIPIIKVLLFGSRSRNDARPDSDWDFLVCIKDELSFSEKVVIATKIQTRLAEKLISVDIIVKSEAKLASERDNVGAITYYALKDGLFL